MEIRILEDFLALARIQSFSRAAEQRHSTQSAFSRRIQALEAWLGVTLVDRGTVPLTITPAGEMFAEVAEDVLRMLRQARDEAKAVAKQQSSVVSFAVTHSLALTFFPRWLREIERDTGPISIALFSHDAERCREAVAEGRCHFMICHFDSRMGGDYDMRRVRSVPVGRDCLIPVIEPARKKLVPELPGRPTSKIPYLAYTEGSSIGRSLELFLQDKTAYVEPRFRTSLADAIKGMILEGEGMGWLPETVIRQELESGRLVRAGDESWDVDVEIRMFRAATRLPFSAERLWKSVSTHSLPAGARH